MLHNDDLEAAIGAGVITQAQADALLAFAAQRHAGAAGLRADEERFRFMRGFNDFFFAIGVMLLGVGIAMYAGMAHSPVVYVVATVVMWALAELLVRRMRLVLPGIVILVFLVMFVVMAVPVADLVAYEPPTSASYVLGFGMIFGAGGALQLAIKAAIAAATAAIFYGRFRFPFALLVAGGGAVVAIVLILNAFVLGNAVLPQLILLLLCGLAAFAAAMRYDLSDRLRATRRSDCAFWLHVLAAPLLVHSLVRLVSPNAFRLDGVSAVMIVAIAVLLTVVALIIDRRALLVSALVYIGSVIAYTLAHAGATATAVGIATLVILGILVLALGVGWTPLRRRVASLMSPKLMDRLPPVVPA
jgi:hypothetical protein